MNTESIFGNICSVLQPQVYFVLHRTTLPKGSYNSFLLQGSVAEALSNMNGSCRENIPGITRKARLQWKVTQNKFVQILSYNYVSNFVKKILGVLGPLFPIGDATGVWCQKVALLQWFLEWYTKNSESHDSLGLKFGKYFISSLLSRNMHGVSSFFGDIHWMVYRCLDGNDDLTCKRG